MQIEQDELISCSIQISGANFTSLDFWSHWCRHVPAVSIGMRKRRIRSTPAAGVGVASFPAPSRLLPNAQGRELHTWAGVGDVLLPLIPAPHAGTTPAWGAVQEPFVGQRCLDAALTVTPRPIHLGREPVWGSAQPCLTFSRCTVETATPLPSVP